MSITPPPAAATTPATDQLRRTSRAAGICYLITFAVAAHPPVKAVR